MNFSNSNFPFFSFPFVYNTIYHQASFDLAPLDLSLSKKVHSVSQTEAEVKVQQVFKKLNKQALIEKLKRFHQDQKQHKKTHWTEQEDNMLQKLVQIQKLQWRRIPFFFKQRTQNMCYSRYRRISMGAKGRNWVKEQEQTLLKLISHYGEKWKFLSSKMPKFSPKQIRERYLNYLRPNISKDDFTYEQDLKICQYVLNEGKHWRKMEQILQGRSEGTIKGRYYGKLQHLIENSLKEQSLQ